MTDKNQTSTSNNNVPFAAKPVTPADIAYLRSKPELNAMPDEVPGGPAFLDPTLMIQTVLGVVPQVEKLRDEITAELPNFKWGRVTHMRDTALALAHLEGVRRQGKRDAPNTVVAKARQTRDLRLADAEPLVARGLLPAQAVANLRHGNSHRQLAIDLLGIANLFDQNYPALEGKTLVTRGDIQEARELAEALLVHLGSKDYAADSDAELNLDRNKLIYLLREDYREVSWAVMYVRRNTGDGERIMPSLRKIQLQYSGARSSASDTPSDEPQDASQNIADASDTTTRTNNAAQVKGQEVDAATLDAMMSGTFEPKA